MSFPSSPCFFKTPSELLERSFACFWNESFQTSRNKLHTSWKKASPSLPNEAFKASLKKLFKLLQRSFSSFPKETFQASLKELPKLP